MRVLVFNCGSSSVKLSVYDQSSQKHTFSCKAERIGTSEAFFTFQDERIEIPEADHHSALQRLVQYCSEDFDVVVHRVVDASVIE